MDPEIARMVINRQADQRDADALERKANRTEEKATGLGLMTDDLRAEIAGQRAQAAKLRGR
ncbi:hypothetical protein [Micromonospora cathayae]|uniref:Uncharacterized protein n=1 Tax=Micromonospora cathayae TaxID=3028804 RepID=A0ABY7ZVU5_9ACTN|nr:hypothetical protein [Micromonospora sp. HUAS 3]WDZ87169.1 hypothetical protein PVK37_12575 [Micromonospora sp. HUAS 3]